MIRRNYFVSYEIDLDSSTKNIGYKHYSYKSFLPNSFDAFLFVLGQIEERFPGKHIHIVSFSRV